MNRLNYYGKYSVPETVRQLWEFEEELRQDGYSLDLDLGLIMTKEDIRYMSTPPDVIPFASCGVDGIHYGFLTDFGMVPDLEQAYIVSVSPMNFDQEVWLVAPNIHDFLRVVYTENSMLYNYFSGVEQYISHQRHREQEEIEERIVRAKHKLQQRFSLEPMADMGDYLVRLEQKRQAEAVFPTRYLSGIIQTSSACEHQRLMIVALKDGPDPEDVEFFFMNASVESRLAFIRDAQSKHLLDRPQLRKSVIKGMVDMGLADEAERLNRSYDYQEQTIEISDKNEITSIIWYTDDSTND
ncbi:hypothetical protein H0178_44800 [Cytobacillus firmus]|uniref:hypothetical protein n=1 Tax=Paenibacillus lautus TaxID=1401 RepID=UPI00384AE4DA|nr:hypothetical protein [Cytobacillus firmus]